MFGEVLYLSVAGIPDGDTWEDWFEAQCSRKWTQVIRTSGGYFREVQIVVGPVPNIHSSREHFFRALFLYLLASLSSCFGVFAILTFSCCLCCALQGGEGWNKLVHQYLLLLPPA